MHHRPTQPQAGGPADVYTLENNWAPMLPRDPTAVTDSWSTDLVLASTVPDPSNLGETARRASVLLDAFSTSLTPPVAGALSVTQ